jgi:hypothetical protein
MEADPVIHHCTAPDGVELAYRQFGEVLLICERSMITSPRSETAMSSSSTSQDCVCLP